MTHDQAVPAGLALLEDEYEILSEIGRGGVSVVYLARDRILGREVAVKVIHDRFLEDQEARVRADSEARTLAQLHHPNIVTILGARRLTDGTLALIMQLARGRTLRACLREVGPFPGEAALTVLRQTAAALGYLHSRGVIHRDVKPDNIFVEEDGRILLSDLGIAKSNDAATSVTLTGVVVGTPAYMSPEQIDGAELDGRSDLYSLGLVGHELLTGKRPWDGDNLFNVILKQKSEALPSLATLRPDIPAHVRQALERAVAKSREERWVDMEEFVHGLEGKASAIAASAARDSGQRGPAGAGEAAAVSESAGRDRAPRVDPEGSAPVDGDEPLKDALAVAAVRAREKIEEQAQMRRWAVAAAIVGVLLGGGALLAVAPSVVRELGALDFVAEPIAADAVGQNPVAADAVAESAAPPARGTAPARSRVRAARPTSPTTPAQRAALARAAAAAESAAATMVAQKLPAGTSAWLETPSSVPAPPVSSALSLPGSVPSTAPISPAPARSPLRPPALRNSEAILRQVRQSYPAALVQAKAGGTAVLSLTINERGRVTASELRGSTGHPELDEVALRVSRRMQFSPAERDGQAVTTQVEVPLTIEP